MRKRAAILVLVVLAAVTATQGASSARAGDETRDYQSQPMPAGLGGYLAYLNVPCGTNRIQVMGGRFAITAGGAFRLGWDFESATAPASMMAHLQSASGQWYELPTGLYGMRAYVEDVEVTGYNTPGGGRAALRVAADPDNHGAFQATAWVFRVTYDPEAPGCFGGSTPPPGGGPPGNPASPGITEPPPSPTPSPSPSPAPGACAAEDTQLSVASGSQFSSTMSLPSHKYAYVTKIGLSVAWFGSSGSNWSVGWQMGAGAQDPVVSLTHPGSAGTETWEWLAPWLGGPATPPNSNRRSISSAGLPFYAMGTGANWARSNTKVVVKYNDTTGAQAIKAVLGFAYAGYEGFICVRVSDYDYTGQSPFGNPPPSPTPTPSPDPSGEPVPTAPASLPPPDYDPPDVNVDVNVELCPAGSDLAICQPNPMYSFAPASIAPDGVAQLVEELKGRAPIGYAYQAGEALADGIASAPGAALPACLDWKFWHPGGADTVDLCFPWDQIAGAASVVRSILLAIVTILFAVALIRLALHTAEG